MIKAIRYLLDLERVTTRLDVAEMTIAMLEDRLTRRHPEPSFIMAKQPFVLSDNIRDEVMERVVRDLSPILEPYLVDFLKNLQRRLTKEGTFPHGSAYAATSVDSAMHVIEIHVPEMHTRIEVYGDSVCH